MLINLKQFLAMASGGSDIAALLRGLLLLCNEVSRQTAAQTSRILSTSSLTSSLRASLDQTQGSKDTTPQPNVKVCQLIT